MFNRAPKFMTTIAMAVALIAMSCTNGPDPGASTTTATGVASAMSTATEPAQPAEPPATEPAQPAEPPATEPAQPAEPPATEPAQLDQPTATEPSEDSSDGALAAILDWLDDRGFNGVVLIETPSDTSVRGFGHADRETRTALDGDTIFDVGSLTKQFTSAAILRLEMDGALSVDSPVGDYVSGLTPAISKLTLHELLTHTSGLPAILGSDYAEVSLDDFVRLVNAATEDGVSAGDYDYSNVGYSLLAAVIESASGQPYERYLRDALFAPSGMESTGYVLADWSESVVAVGYSGETRWGRPNEQPWAEDGPYWHLRGNGGIMSSANDMLRWDRALLGETILDAAAKEKLYGRHTEEGPNSGTYYGYGWALFPTSNDTWLVTHNGGNGIFFADFLRFLDEGVTIFIASNAASEEFVDVAFELAASVFDGTELAPAPNCGLRTPVLDELVEVAEFSETEAGQVANHWFELLATGDDQERLAFVEAHVDPFLVPGATTAEIAAGIARLQDELAGSQVVRRFSDADRRFHVEMELPSDDDITVSVELAAQDPSLISCYSVDN